jgi:hypothetical protein
MLRYVCSLPNPGANGAPRELFYTDDEAGHAKAAAFIQREDKQPGRGIYYCVGKLRDGARSRCKDTVVELDHIVIDLDLKNIAESRDNVLRTLQNLVLPPTEIRDTGYGLHAEWRMKEPANDEAGMTQIEAIKKRLAALLAGDPAPTHRAALMRQPGTHNMKGETPRRCHTIWQSETRCDVSEFDEVFDLYGDRLLLTRKEAPKRNGHDSTDDTRIRDFRKLDGTLDVDAWFAAMPPTSWGANQFQPPAITALLCEGRHPEEIIATVAAKTVERVPEWDPSVEIKEVTKRINSSLGNLHRGYDPATGAIPDWVHGDFRSDWAAELAACRRPQLTRNKKGFYVRGWDIPDTAKAQGKKAESVGAKTEDAAKAKDGPKKEAADEPKGKPKDGAAKIRAIPFEDFDEARVERRAHLYGKHCQRGQVTATIGPGGAGKSSLDLVECLAMATSRNLLGEQPAERCRVWIHNGDDDTREMKRRVAAVCRHYGIPKSELVGWLFVTTKSDFTIKVAGGNGSLVIDHASVAQIVHTITENEIDVVVFEPLVTLHGVSENDNVKMNAVLHIFSEIADGCDCGFDVCHHTRKLMAGTEEYSSDDGRGASAIRDAVRCSRVLNSISREEARKAGIDEQERAFYFRVDSGKANYLPPSTKATWRKFENVRLLNDDDVGVVTEWKFQDAPSALSDDACEKIQSEVAKGNYREFMQRSPDKWIGRVVAKHLKLNPNEEANDWTIKRAIRDLENKGVITYEERKLPDDNYKPASYAVPGGWKKGATT